MALYNVFGQSQSVWNSGEKLTGNSVQDSSPLFIYSPPGAWIDTPLELDNSPSLVRRIPISKANRPC